MNEQLSVQALEAAKISVCDSLSNGWDDIWAAKIRAAREWIMDEKDAIKFHYGVSIKLDLKPLGAGGLNVASKATWSETHCAEALPQHVSDEPELFDEAKLDLQSVEGELPPTEPQVTDDGDLHGPAETSLEDDIKNGGEDVE